MSSGWLVVGTVIHPTKFDKFKVVEIYSNFPSKYIALGWELYSCEVPEWFAFSN
jgi:hypothetical protein